jgi:hypothetical protein
MYRGIGRVFAAFLIGMAAPAAAGDLIQTPHAKVTILYRFSGGSDGGNPYGPLVADQAGNLYGIAALGGDAGLGVVFELASGPNDTWTETVLHSFSGSDGAYPNPGLTFDAQGNLYGTTFAGGQTGGVAFELSPGQSGAWSFSLLNSFGSASSPGGSEPNGNLVLDTTGNAYGTTQLGGAGVCSNFPGPCGVVFELSPAGSGTWTESVLYSFKGRPDGEFPYASVFFDSAGNLDGTTNEGGSGKCNDGEGAIIGCGTVFALSPSGGGWSETQLYNFKKSEQNMPGSTLVSDSNGSLFGTAGYDVFRVRPVTGGKWKKETIYEFTEGIGGTIPSSGVTFDSQGNLYGTTSSSRLSGFSTVFELSPPAMGEGAWSEATLAKFGKGFDSNQPRGGVLLAGNGAIYGAVSGTAGRGYVFAIKR